MQDFSYLANLVVSDQKEGKRNKSKEQQIQELQGNIIRLYKNGEVYPSKDLVNLFNLEYVTDKAGNGLDLVDSTEWAPVQQIPRTIFVGVVSKSEPKVDLFATTRYTEEGNPVSSVLTQGTTSEHLLNIARSMGWLTEEDSFVDLEVMIKYPVKTADGISYIPKMVERGEKKNQKTYSRRENVTFFPLTKVTTDTVAQPTPTMSGTTQEVANTVN